MRTLWLAIRMESHNNLRGVMNTRYAALSLLLPVLFLTACSSPEHAPVVSGAPSSEPSSEGPKLNAHGNWAKGLGEEAAVLFPGSDDDAITFKLVNVAANPECDPTFYMPPQNGSYIVLEFEFETSPDYLDAMPGATPLRFYWYDFNSYAADGTKVQNTANGVGCLTEAETGSLDLPAGAVTTARYAIDVPADVASIELVPEMLGGELGWEWQLSAS